MSRPFIRKPEFRLHFGYPLITLTRGDDPAAVRVARLGEPSFPDDFCGLGDEVARAAGQLTVVLPEAEVWRGLLDLAGRTAFGRWREARAAVAARLSLLPGALAVAVGPRDTFGRIPVAAVPRQTLRETRSFLAGGGLRPAAIIGAGTFPGFSAPPRFASGVRRLPALASLLRPERRGVAAAGLAATLTLATALGLALAPQAPAPRAGLGPAPAAGLPAVDLAALVIPPPRPRPDPMPRPPANVVRAAPPAQRAPAPAATVAARNLPLLGLGEVPALPDGLRLTKLSTARVRLSGGPIATTRRSPGPPAASAPAPAAAALTGPRPMPRPAPVAAATPAAKAPVAPGPQASRPMPRPETAGPALATAITEAVAEAAAEPVVVASLAPAEATAAGLAAALTAMPPVPRPAARVRAAAPAPAPKVVRRAAPPPRVVAVQPVRVQPAAPVRQQQAVRRVAAPAPKQVVRQPATTAGRTARAPRNLALIGVFGASGNRHALVRLPTGDVRRVRPGDHLQGAQVASVGSDSLRLRGGGREMVLSLP